MAVNIAGFGLLEIEKLTLQKRASKSVRSSYNGIWYKVKDFGFWNLKSDDVFFQNISCIANHICRTSIELDTAKKSIKKR